LDNCGVETEFGSNDDFLIDALLVMDAADAVIEAMQTGDAARVMGHCMW
jgi:hypothetical protein